jgi:hypothetical protein
VTTTCDCDACGNELCPGDVLCGTCGEECDPDKTRGFVIKREMSRGETAIIKYVVVDPVTGAPIDLSIAGVKLWFTVKDYLMRADSQAAWQGIIGTGIVVDIPKAGAITVTMPASVTQYLNDGVEKLYYDLKLLDGAGTARVVEKGLFKIAATTTRAIA